jgi:hypothetical protein
MHTKNPAEAKRLSIKLCALLSERNSTSTNLIDLDSVGVKVGHNQQQECIGMANEKSIPMGLITTVSLFGGRTVKMEVDQNDPKDVRAAQKLMKVVIAQDVKESGLGGSDYWPNQTQTIVQSALATTPVKPNSSILELIERYHSRNNGRHALKTLYEYEKMQRRFFGWVSAKYNNDQHPLRDVMRGDIAEFIDELQKENVSLQTIQKKYLAALNGLFVLGSPQANIRQVNFQPEITRYIRTGTRRSQR